MLLVTLFIGASCGDKKDNKKDPTKAHGRDTTLLAGDETIYGLACEGCTDSAVVLLPEDGSDPITYNTLRANKRHRILGKLKVGDWIGVVLNKKDSTVADMVVDLDELMGIWCYIVMPRPKGYENMSDAEQRAIIESLPDSVKTTYIIPREYGFWMKRQWVCQSVGYVRDKSSLEDESPVVYQPLGYFTAWHLWNGKLVITSGKPDWSKGANKIEVSNLQYDTCDIDYLMNDSLVLSDRDGSRSYYRKNDINEVNKKAKAIAELLSRKALKETTSSN